MTRHSIPLALCILLACYALAHQPRPAPAPAAAYPIRLSEAQDAAEDVMRGLVGRAVSIEPWTYEDETGRVRTVNGMDRFIDAQDVVRGYLAQVRAGQE